MLRAQRTYSFRFQREVWSEVTNALADVNALKELADRPVQNPSVTVSGTVTVDNLCSKDPESVHIAMDLSNVKVVCSEAAAVECNTRYASVKQKLEPFDPFHFEQLTNGTVKEIEYSTPTEATGSKDSVLNELRRGLVDMLSVPTDSCCNISTQTFLRAKTDKGVHTKSAGGSAPYGSFSIRRVYWDHHASSGSSSQDGEGTDFGAPGSPYTWIRQAEARSMHVVDWHGRTQSGRQHAHHIVHASGLVRLLNSEHPPWKQLEEYNGRHIPACQAEETLKKITRASVNGIGRNEPTFLSEYEQVSVRLNRRLYKQSAASGHQHRNGIGAADLPSMLTKVVSFLRESARRISSFGLTVKHLSDDLHDALKAVDKQCMTAQSRLIDVEQILKESGAGGMTNYTPTEMTDAISTLLGETLKQFHGEAFDTLNELVPAMAGDLKPFLKIVRNLLGAMQPAGEASESKTGAASIGEVLRLVGKIPPEFRQAWEKLPVFKSLFGKGRGLLASIQTITTGEVEEHIMQVVQRATGSALGDLRQKLKATGLSVSKLSNQPNLHGNAQVFLKQARDAVASFQTDMVERGLNGIVAMQEATGKLQTLCDKVDQKIQKLISSLAEGKSLVARKEWDTPMLKGWTTKIYVSGTISAGMRPEPTAQGKVAVGIDYHAHRPERMGNIAELSLEVGAKATSVRGKTRLQINPDLAAIAPMLSVLGSPPIPIGGRPEAIVISIIDALVQRLLQSLRDPGAWFSVAQGLLLNNFLGSPAISSELGGLAPGTVDTGTYDVSELSGIRNLETAVQKRFEEVCAKKFTSEQSTPAQTTSKLEIFADMMSKPFSIVSSLFVVLQEGMTEFVKVLSTINELQSVAPEVHSAACSIQDHVLGGAEKACHGFRSIVEVAGSGKSTIVNFLTETVGCEANATGGSSLRSQLKPLLDLLYGNGTLFNGLLSGGCQFPRPLTQCKSSKETLGAEETVESVADADNSLFEGIFTALDVFRELLPVNSTGKVKMTRAFLFKWLHKIKAAARVDPRLPTQSAAALEDQPFFSELTDTGILSEKSEHHFDRLLTAAQQMQQKLTRSKLGVLVNVFGQCQDPVRSLVSMVHPLTARLGKTFEEVREIFATASEQPKNFLVHISDKFAAVSKLFQQFLHEVQSAIPRIVGQLDPCIEMVSDLAISPSISPLQDDSFLRMKSTAVQMLTASRKAARFMEEAVKKISPAVQFVSKGAKCLIQIIESIAETVTSVEEAMNDGVVESPEALDTFLQKIQTTVNMPCLQDIFVRDLGALMSKSCEEKNCPAHKLKTAFATFSKILPIVSHLLVQGVKVFGTAKQMVSVVGPALKSVGTTSSGRMKIMSSIRNFQASLGDLGFSLQEMRDLISLMNIDEEAIDMVMKYAIRTVSGAVTLCDALQEKIESIPLRPAVLLEEHSGVSLRVAQRLRSQRSAKGTAREEPGSNLDANEKLSLLTSKLDQQNRLINSKFEMLQHTADRLSVQIAGSSGKGGGSTGQSTTDDAGRAKTDEEKAIENLKKSSKQFLVQLREDRKLPECPLTHDGPEDGAHQSLLAERSIDLVTDVITVPPQLTYGADVKIAFYVRAVGSFYLDWLTCNCNCEADFGNKLRDCADIMIVSPHAELHILGSGSISLGVKILTLAITANLQLGSLNVKGSLHVSRGIKKVREGKQLVRPSKYEAPQCISEVPKEDLQYLFSVASHVYLGMLQGNMKLGVTFAGLNLETPPVNWPGITWNLIGFCTDFGYALAPPVCPNHPNPAFEPRPVTFSVGTRPVESSTCSVCVFTPKDGNNEDWACQHTPDRFLAVAGYSDMVGIRLLGRRIVSLFHDTHQKAALKNEIIRLGLIPESSDKLFSQILFLPVSPAHRTLSKNSHALLCGEDVRVIQSGENQDSMVVYTGHVHLRYQLPQDLDLRESVATFPTNLKAQISPEDMYQASIHSRQSEYPFTLHLRFEIRIPDAALQTLDNENEYEVFETAFLSQKTVKKNMRFKHVRDGMWEHVSTRGVTTNMKLLGDPRESKFMERDHGINCDAQSHKLTSPMIPQISQIEMSEKGHAVIEPLLGLRKWGDSCKSPNACDSNLVCDEDIHKCIFREAEISHGSRCLLDRECLQTAGKEGLTLCNLGICAQLHSDRLPSVVHAPCRSDSECPEDSDGQRHCKGSVIGGRKLGGFFSDKWGICRAARSSLGPGETCIDDSECNGKESVCDADTRSCITKETLSVCISCSESNMDNDGMCNGGKHIFSSCSACSHDRQCEKDADNKIVCAFPFNSHIHQDVAGVASNAGRKVCRYQKKLGGEACEDAHDCLHRICHGKDTSKILSSLTRTTGACAYERDQALSASCYADTECANTNVCKLQHSTALAGKCTKNPDVDQIDENVMLREKRNSLGTEDLLDRKSQRLLDRYSARVMVPDMVAENLVVEHGSVLDIQPLFSASPVNILPPFLQISYDKYKESSITGIESGCLRPWHRDLQVPGDYSEAGVANIVCRSMKAEIESAEHVKPITSYSELRSDAIRGFDNEPCLVPGLLETNESISIGTQQCYTCTLSGLPREGDDDVRSEIRMRCPVSNRRSGLLAAAHTLGILDSRAECPSANEKPSRQFSELDYLRTLMYSQGQRLRLHLKDNFGLDDNLIGAEVTLCGETLTAHVPRLAGLRTKEAGDSRCKDFAARHDFEGKSKANWAYSGIAYINVHDLDQTLEKDLPSASGTPALRSIAFKLDFTSADIFKKNFFLKSTGTSMQSLDSFCEKELAELNDPGTALFCNSRNEYMDLYLQSRQMWEIDESIRRPCRVDPVIDTKAYTQSDSQYRFFGASLGALTTQDMNFVRTNKMCRLCTRTFADERDESLSSLRQLGRTIFGDDAYHCDITYDNLHSESDQGEDGRKQDEMERIAALDLFEESEIEKNLPKNVIDHVIRQTLMVLGKNKDKYGTFWGKVLADQMNSNRDFGHKSAWRKIVSRVAVCDEVGMENLPIPLNGNGGKTARLFRQAQAPGGAHLYGGTLCARFGADMECVQYVVPLDYAKAKYNAMADNDKGSDPDKNIAVWDPLRLRILELKSSSTEDASSEKGSTVGGGGIQQSMHGHKYFFASFISVLIENEKDSVCPTTNELQTPGSTCSDIYTCKPPRWPGSVEHWDGNSYEKPECAAMLSKDSDLAYSQRLVDSKTCVDAVGHLMVN